MARIAERDRVVEIRGLSGTPSFEVGGKHGNVVTKSSVSTVHKGWRAVAVDGRRMPPAELGRALAGARQRARFTVTFRIGEPDERDGDEVDADGFDASSRSVGRAASRKGSKESAALEEKAEEAAATAEEEARRAAEEEAARRKAAEEAARSAAEEAARRAAEEVVRAEVVKRLEERSGLPPRSQTPDPQQALMQALARAAPPVPEKKRGGPCDKCDGPHHEDDCPHFKGKKREEHKDAWDKYGRSSAADVGSGVVVLTSARIVPQPGDGSCLFHSLAYGLGGGANADELRASIADYIAANPEAVVGGNPLKDWVLWDSGLDVQAYARTMRTGSRWGGALELAVCAQVQQVSVHVYERGSKGFARISTFGTGSRTVNVHYGGRVHYDALEV